MDRMDMDKRRGEPEGCLVAAIRLPVRIVALVVVVPVRLVWDALVVSGRFLYEKALVPLGRGLGLLLGAVLVWPFVMLGRALAWLCHVLIAIPARWLYAHVLTPLGHGLVWLTRTLIVVPAVWLYSQVLVPLGRAVLTGLRWLGLALFVWPWVALWRYVLTPLGHGLAWLGRVLVVIPLTWLGRVLVVIPLTWLWTYVLAPVGRALALAAAGLGRGLATLLRWVFVVPLVALWRYVLVPVGRALRIVGRETWDALVIAWRIAGRISRAVGRFLGRLLRWTFVEPARWTYRTVLTPLGHAVRDHVWRPAARIGREVRASVRQARAEVRRALFGAPKRPAHATEPLVGDRREPHSAQARTLGSSTTPLTKTDIH
ncbi:hypothetical protein [Streptomyces xanthii]|uniref:Uncharacterized protein n=1 Tax=Streptomyces xanthii TaxID=2768069 RepID=A0A7H1BC26_9ACTN|nr:hypothetical protein [Streptomyces xanthii]QNS06281.1 hypothetical protein IAG42_23675 [Streptomyces xanthii]